MKSSSFEIPQTPAAVSRQRRLQRGGRGLTSGKAPRHAKPRLNSSAFWNSCIDVVSYDCWPVKPWPGTGNARADFPAGPRSLRRGEDSCRLPRLGGPSGIATGRRLSQRFGLLQPRKTRNFGPANMAGRSPLTAKPDRIARDPYLNANLRQALSVAPGRLPEPPPAWWQHVLFWSGWLSFPEKVYGAFAGFLLAATVVTAALLFRRPRAYWLGGSIGGRRPHLEASMRAWLVTRFTRRVAPSSPAKRSPVRDRQGL